MIKKRIDIIDALRGLAVVLMVFHHFMYDLVVFLSAPVWLFSNPVFNFLHYIFAGLFILLSGISSRFSRSNVKRGAKVIAIALVITAVTYFMRMPVFFGILHLLGFCMIFYGLTQKLWDKIPKRIMPTFCISFTVLSAIAVSSIKVSVDFLWIFGFPSENFFSSDYFPIFPWIFVFLLGTWCGKFIIDGKLPKWFYDFTMPVLPQIGRKALIIYILHQPVLILLTVSIAFII